MKIAVVPFHLGMKFDGMMSFDRALAHQTPQDGQIVGHGLMPDPLVGMWLKREANRVAHLGPDDIGVVVLAHGSSFDWNETIRQAVRPIEDRYKIEYAFSMADREVIEGAMRRLEARGARAIVVVRVFGLATSFQSTVDRLLGLDIEAPQRAESRPAMAHGAHGHGHGHMHAGSPQPRIRTAAITTTVGGLEDSPLFAKALAERVAEISRDPRHETVILVAHGIGSDQRNEHWLKILNSLASQMQAAGEIKCRAFHVGTWREDWPDKRGEWVARIRGWVSEASNNGGHALVIPARTSGQGPAQKLLEGLDFKLGHGFAPHPLFAKWIEGQIKKGSEKLRQENIARR